MRGKSVFKRAIRLVESARSRISEIREEVREELAIEETVRKQLLRELRFDEAFESIEVLRRFLDSAERSLKSFREVLERSCGDPVAYSAVQPYVKMAAHGLQRKLRILRKVVEEGEGAVRELNARGRRELEAEAVEA